jgi:hypothetical protein
VLHVILDASRTQLALADAEELRELRFAFAVLRDVFPRDADIRRWLTSPSTEIHDGTPATVLSLGRVQEFSDLAVAEWNRPRINHPPLSSLRWQGVEQRISLGGVG